MNTRQRCFTAILLVLLMATLCHAQTTSVTLQVTDLDTQTWNNGTWSVQIYSPPGVPCCKYNIAGGTTPVPNQTQSGLLSSSGGATFATTPNTSIAPSGTLWTFNVCPQAYPTQCFTKSFTITGASQTVIINPPAIRININNPVGRVTAYLDIETTNGSLGSSYFNLLDGLIHVCTAVTSVCTYTPLSSGSIANFASPPPLGNIAPNTVAGTVVNITGNGLFFVAQPTCLFGESNNTLDELEDVGGIPMWLPQGALGPCSQFLTYTPLPVGVTPTDKQVVAYNLATNSWTVQTQTGSGNPAFSALTSATNSTATMTVGTGASMNTSGTGSIQATGLPRSTVAFLPINLPTSTVYEVTDGAFQGDCSLGAGSFPALCAWNGSIWQSIGDGGGITTNPSTINMSLAYHMSCVFVIGTGTATTTSGLVNSGSTSIPVASGTGFTAGQGIYIAGAGAAGGPYNGIIISVVSNTITVNTATSTSVTNAFVNNYSAAVQTTTNGTVSPGTSIPVVNSVTFFQGQGIFIAGAGAAAADYVGTVQSVSGNTITVTPATSTSVTNALVQHDESAAMNNAIADLASGVTNGTLQPPPGICNFNGPLKDTSFANAIINLPNIPDLCCNGGSALPTGPALSIDIEGASNQLNGSNQYSNYYVTPPSGGTIFQTTRAAGSLIAAFGHATGNDANLDAIDLRLRNLTFRAPANPAITMVDASNVVAFYGENLEFDTMIAGTQAAPPQPTHSNGRGLLMPGSANYGQSYASNVFVTGYFTGFVPSEHTVANLIYLRDNWFAMDCQMTSTNHSMYLGYVDVESNAYGVTSTTSCNWLDIESLDYEDSILSPSWVTAASNHAIIYDPTNNILNGVIYLTTPGTAIQNGTALLLGAQHVQLFQTTIAPTGMGNLAWTNGLLGDFATQFNPSLVAKCGQETILTFATTASAAANGCLATNFNFTGKTISVRAPIVALPSDAVDVTELEIGNNVSNYLRLFVNSGILKLQKNVSGSITTLATLTYNPVAMKWWRLAESSGAITTSYSPDGINWTVLNTCAATCVSWSYTATTVSLSITCFGAACTTPGYSVFDNFSINGTPQNYPPLVTSDGIFGSYQEGQASACETSFAATTLSTVATTTDTGLSCLPANAIIDAVVYRVTTTITTAATFQIGDSTTAGRFSSSLSSTPCGGGLTAGSTGICFVQADQTGAAGPRQSSVAKVRVTTNVNPGAGVIRLIVYYHTWTAPTL